LPQKKLVPECQRNRCPENNVFYLNRCARLNENSGCPRHLKLQINATSLDITCALNFESRFGEDTGDTVKFTAAELDIIPVDSIGALCVFGSRRHQENSCGNSTSV
jgi:hypothetical protein